MVVTLTTSGACILKAGKNLSSDLTTGSGANSQLANDIWTDWINAAESTINVATRKDWVANYAGLATDVKKILDHTCSSLAAMNAINYDMSGYTSRSEAETMLDKLNNDVTANLNILKDLKQQEFMGVA